MARYTDGMTDPGAYPAAWYPICRGSDLRRGRVLRLRAWGREWAVWRGATGKVALVDAVCSHMGANLGRGQVVDGSIQCPLHHWRYAPEGGCVHIPGAAAIPTRARQQALPCVERYGLVFAFLGESPAYALPVFAGEEADPVYSRASATDVAAPYAALVANSFDGQHFATVHDRELLAPVEVCPEGDYGLCIAYRARVVGRRLGDRLMRAVGIDTVGVTIRCWGGNVMQVYNARTANTILVALLPVDATMTRVFVTTVMAQAAKGPARLAQHAYLALAHALTLGFLRPDMAVLEGMELRPRVLIPELDGAFLTWLRYWKALPRADDRPVPHAAPVTVPVTGPVGE